MKTVWMRRTIFAALAVAVAIPMLTRVALPMFVSRPARALYDAIEAVPPDKVIVVTTNWDAGSQGETRPQTAALLRHLMLRGKKFAIWSFAYTQGPKLAEDLADKLAKEYGRTYGEDWVNWGYKTGLGPMLKAWCDDIHKIVGEDAIQHRPIGQIPLMKSVHTIRDVGLVIDITPSSTLDLYLRFVQGVHGTKLGYACTGVMVPEAFPYLDSHQIVGMLRGLAGAAEYEKLVNTSGQGTAGMSAQSFAHVLIIALIIIGNIGYLRSRRQSSQQ